MAALIVHLAGHAQPDPKPRRRQTSQTTNLSAEV